jgi:OmcA/MtrC family decaheme c-type cytochrome
LKENDGTVLNPQPFGSNLNLLMGGPTKDYAINPIRENASGASFDGTVATYTFTRMIPADAVGTWAFSIEARRTVTLNPGTTDQMNVTEGAFNPVKYAAVTDSQPVPRRAVVDMAKCNTCHDRLALHGGQRLNVEECIMCHNANASDTARRPADKAPVESIHFKRMIHRIHTGEELTQDLTIYGFFTPPNPPNPINFNEVRFPGDRRDCQTCHIANTYQPPLPDDALPTETLRDYYSPQQPVAAACLGCHDTRSAAAHAFVNTAPFGEACASCHGPNAEFAVDKVHAR